MKKSKIIVPVLWGFCTLLWVVAVIMDVSSGNTQGTPFVLHCVCVATSLVAAVTNLIAYLRNKGSE